MDARYDDDPAARRRVAHSYRALRTRELNEAAAKAVGRPVEAAASFNAKGSRMMFKVQFYILVPVVGWLFGLRHAYRTRGFGRTRMLALDAEFLYAIGLHGWTFEHGETDVIRRWPRHEVKVLEMRESGTDTLVTFKIGAERREYRFYCSSVPTNPWAAELLRRLGSQTPPAITAI